jgi:hypothetical protein
MKSIWADGAHFLENKAPEEESSHDASPSAHYTLQCLCEGRTHFQVLIPSEVMHFYKMTVRVVRVLSLHSNKNSEYVDPLSTLKRRTDTDRQTDMMMVEGTQILLRNGSRNAQWPLYSCNVTRVSKNFLRLGYGFLPHHLHAPFSILLEFPFCSR